MLDGVLRRSRAEDERAVMRLETVHARQSGSSSGGWVPDLPSVPPDAATATGEPRGAPRAWGERLDPGRRGLAVLAVVALLAGAAGAGAAWRARPRAVEVRTPPVTATAAPVLVVVDVAGRVRRPGLVRLPLGSRVADALARAGGALPGGDLSALNLARKVVDGEQVRVGVPAAGAGPGGSSGSDGRATGLIDLNSATVEQLDALPGVGPVLAQRIVDYRSTHGSFGAVAQLREVSGIGERKYEELRRRVRV